jgi:SET domain-containing protein
MLLIKTDIKISTIIDADLGLFTSERLYKGQIIWKNSEKDIELSNEEYLFLKDIDCHEWVEKYGTSLNNKWQIDHDSCKYMNHSYTPNIHFELNFGFCLDDIKPGEELFCDYTTITSPEHFKKLIK